MPKKRVGVSLRKPSPAPEAAAESAEVAVEAVASVSAEREPSAAEAASRAADGAFLREATAALELALEITRQIDAAGASR